MLHKNYYAKYPFVYQDIFLIAQINPSTGKQWLIMQKIDPISNRVLLEDRIQCIHTAITTLTVEEFQNQVRNEDFEKKMSNIRSSENLKEIQLEIEEKFFAFKSWVAGIAEGGINSISIQSDIELYSRLMYPISNRLFNFLLKAKGAFLQDFLWAIERDCKFEGRLHQPCVNANLLKILDIIVLEEKEAWNIWRDQVESSYNWSDKWNLYLIKDFEEFLTSIIDLQPSAQIFLEKEKYNFFLNTKEAKKLPDLEKTIMDSVSYENKYFFSFEDEQTRLTTLDMSEKDITDMKKIEGFSRNLELQQLSLYANKIERIEGLENLSNLRQLHLSNNRIEEIGGLKNLKKLEILDLSYNYIDKISGLDHLNNLKELFLINNKIKRLEGLQNLKSLEKLVISSNQIQKLEGIGELKQLTYLNLSWNQIKEIEGLKNLKNLHYLGVGGNEISKVSGLESLKKLNKFEIYDNNLEEMPDLSYLPELKYFSISNNKFNKI